MATDETEYIECEAWVTVKPEYPRNVPPGQPIKALSISMEGFTKRPPSRLTGTRQAAMKVTVRVPRDLFTIEPLGVNITVPASMVRVMEPVEAVVTTPNQGDAE